MLFFFLMIRRPPRSTLDRSSAASDVYKRQGIGPCLGVDAVLDGGVLGVQAKGVEADRKEDIIACLLYTSPSPRDRTRSRMPSSA